MRKIACTLLVPLSVEEEGGLEKAPRRQNYEDSKMETKMNGKVISVVMVLREKTGRISQSSGLWNQQLLLDELSSSRLVVWFGRGRN